MPKITRTKKSFCPLDGAEEVVMSLLPKNTELGRLELLEEYVFGNFPCLFTCRNDRGQTYLAVWEDGSDNDDSWLYALLSHSRLRDLKSGRVDFHDAFAHTEDGNVYWVTIPKHGSEPASAHSLTCSELSLEYLPIPGVLLDLAPHPIVGEYGE